MSQNCVGPELRSRCERRRELEFDVQVFPAESSRRSPAKVSGNWHRRERSGAGGISESTYLPPKPCHIERERERKREGLRRILRGFSLFFSEAERDWESS